MTQFRLLLAGVLVAFVPFVVSYLVL